MPPKGDRRLQVCPQVVLGNADQLPLPIAQAKGARLELIHEGAWGKAVAVDRKKVAKTAMTLNLNSTFSPFPPFGTGTWCAWSLDAKCHWPFLPLL
jgi:hypothetical protein